eukprot:scaffold17359_cov142-Isochrysis_galbana.AAC.3
MYQNGPKLTLRSAIRANGPVRRCRVIRTLRTLHPAEQPRQPRIPEIIGHAPGENVKGGRAKGGDAIPPEDSRVSCRIRPVAHLILFFFMCHVNIRGPLAGVAYPAFPPHMLRCA